MERMKPQRCRRSASPTPFPLPSPHLIFISGAASVALGRELRNLTPAPLPRLELGPCEGEGTPGTQRKSLEAPPQDPAILRDQAQGKGGMWDRSGIESQ